MPEEKRVTRQIRIHEDTAQVIEEIIRRMPERKTFADAVEQAFRTAYPKMYNEVLKSGSHLDEIFSEEINPTDDD